LSVPDIALVEVKKAPFFTVHAVENSRLAVDQDYLDTMCLRSPDAPSNRSIALDKGPAPGIGIL
jgi:hypothetical protein